MSSFFSCFPSLRFHPSIYEESRCGLRGLILHLLLTSGGGGRNCTSSQGSNLSVHLKGFIFQQRGKGTDVAIVAYLFSLLGT